MGGGLKENTKIRPIKGDFPHPILYEDHMDTPFDVKGEGKKVFASFFKPSLTFR